MSSQDGELLHKRSASMSLLHKHVDETGSCSTNLSMRQGGMMKERMESRMESVSGVTPNTRRVCDRNTS